MLKSRSECQCGGGGECRVKSEHTSLSRWCKLFISFLSSISVMDSPVAVILVLVSVICLFLLIIGYYNVMVSQKVPRSSQVVVGEAAKEGNGSP